MSRVKTFQIEETIDKAIDVFREKGYQGTSMQDLVSALSLNRSSIYQTFRSKEELYLVSLDRYGDQTSDITAILYEPGTCREVLMRFFAKLIEHNSVRTCLLVYASLEMGEHPEVRERVSTNNNLRERAFFQLLSRGTANGEIKGNPNLRVLSQYLVNVANGITVTSASAGRNTLDNILEMSLFFLR
ncbi:MULTISPECIES: TetR/AcrR family transcriptional regulator [unclassified Paenibacillus]|uniref:TetR/AcrR family transcriptional regulator n=1 Tax=unclassified Paenibacillus TaxID=185978 RepID=UPI00104E58FF|nr:MULTISPECIES: TetR/AcrR family transcriptional regulator [unclassified Paenibacillus]NIK67016.1 TetR/AcrR family transcriptional repressor of nem operon [Paenibacillus sp. BK720]TCN01068.1 TetR family transcriptional regulator [Paenibacillus sp. BK033]